MAAGLTKVAMMTFELFVKPGPCCRKYIVSADAYKYKTTKSYESFGFEYCKGKGMGLAMWHTAELYEDIKYLAQKANMGLYTALCNIDLRDCASKGDCHGQLIWKQEELGAEEYFETNVAYNSISAKSDTGYTAQVFKKDGDVIGREYWTQRKVVCGGRSY